MYFTVRLAGYGGYGIVTAGRILGIAFTRQGYHALQTESHGAAARGGACTADVTISDKPIYELHFNNPHILVVQSLLAFERYAARPTNSTSSALKSSTADAAPGVPQIVLLESKLLSHPKVASWVSSISQGTPPSCHQLPARRIAQKLGHVRYMGVAALGALTKIHPQITFSALSSVVKKDPKLKRFQRANIQALRLGAQLVNPCHKSS